MDIVVVILHSVSVTVFMVVLSSVQSDTVDKVVHTSVASRSNTVFCKVADSRQFDWPFLEHR